MTVTSQRRAIYRRTEDVYRKAIEDMRDYAIFMIDPNGLITNWNIGAQLILGYTAEEIIGKNAAKIFTAEDRAKGAPQSELATAATTGRSDDERWHVRRDGSRFWASGIVSSVRDRNGELVGFSKVMRDMTERNRLTEERDRFFALSMDMLSVVQLDGKFQRVNPAFQRVLGFTEEELLAMDLFELIHPDDLAKTLEEYQNLSAGKPVRFMENRLRAKDQTYRWVAWSYFPVPEERLAFGVGRDTTELHKMAEVLHMRAEELENANRIKDEFLATMSHELRTPLTSILGWARLLDSDRLAPEERERAIEVIQRNAEAQTRLVEDLLDVSRIISGKLKIEFLPVSFATVIDSVVNSLRPTADAKRLKLELNMEPMAGVVIGDPARIQQIVTNIISNAIKFTPAGGWVRVTLTQCDHHARLTVADNGIGIAQEHLPHIFERFRQVDSSNIRAHGGLGIGLAIVDYLVRQQKGSVTAFSEGVGQGSTFTVEFPLTSVAGSLPATETIPPKQRLKDLEEIASENLKERRILVVEDDEYTQEFLQTVLERYGASVVTVGSVAAALKEIKRVKPDIIISDIAMAGQNGYEFIMELRSLTPDEGGRIPAVALSAYAGPSHRRQALLAGFQTHLAKPVEPEDLLAVILSLTF
jgi:PAS domain S-box-containing protein